MNRTALCLLALGVAASAGDEWQSQLTRQPGTFPLLRPLKATYGFGWSALNAGTAEAEFSRTKSSDCQLKIQGGTTGAVRALWRMNSDAVSTVKASTLLAEKLVQKEVYSDESRTTTVDFGPEGVSRKRDRKPVDKDSGKTKKFKFAPVHDMHSALLFIRSQPLEKGDVVKLAVYPGAQAYLTEAEVIGREKVSAAGTKWPAIKVALRLRKISKEMELEAHRKFKGATVWISDDDDRLLLRVEAEVMVGKVWMEMKSVAWMKP
jgi:hypothetical protein